jgi:hypothetical protein
MFNFDLVEALLVNATNSCEYFSGCSECNRPLSLEADNEKLESRPYSNHESTRFVISMSTFPIERPRATEKLLHWRGSMWEMDLICVAHPGIILLVDGGIALLATAMFGVQTFDLICPVRRGQHHFSALLGGSGPLSCSHMAHDL